MRPLDGITVVSLEHAIAAPFCTRQLADLGARVIKVERPGAGDFARAYDQRVKGQSSHFVWTNRSKESLALDLKDARGLAVLSALLARADVQQLEGEAIARAVHRFLTTQDPGSGFVTPHPISSPAGPGGSPQGCVDTTLE